MICIGAISAVSCVLSFYVDDVIIGITKVYNNYSCTPRQIKINEFIYM